MWMNWGYCVDELGVLLHQLFSINSHYLFWDRLEKACFLQTNLKKLSIRMMRIFTQFMPPTSNFKTSATALHLHW